MLGCVSAEAARASRTRDWRRAGSPTLIRAQGLQRDAAVQPGVPCAVHHAHAALADPGLHAVRPQHFAGRQRRRLRAGQSVQDGVLQRLAFRVQQSLDFLAQRGIGGERLFHVRAPFPFGQLQRGAEDFLQTRPSLGRHVAVLAETSRYSHALAMAQSRFTVRGEMLIASAVSSTVIPQK